MANYSPEMPQKLAEAALRLYSRRGFDHVSVGEVAQEAGVTKGSLYWHFKSKRELILAACSQYYRQYHRRMHAEAALASDPLRRLERVVRMTVRNCLMDAENRLFTMEILTLAMQDEEIRNGWRQFFDSARETFLGLVEAARASEQLEAATPEKSVNLMLDALEGIKLRAMFEPALCSPDGEKAISDCLMEVLQGGRKKATAPA